MRLSRKPDDTRKAIAYDSDMTFCRRALLVLVAVIASACARIEVQQLAAKCDFSGDARFMILQGKIPLNMKQATASPTLSEISNENKPTPEERNALLQFDSAGEPCRNGALDIADRYTSPEIAGALREYALAQLNIYRLLVLGDLSYGKAWETRYGPMAHWQQIVGQYDRARQISDAAAQQAAAAQISAAAQAFSAFNQHPTVTNCTALGPNISCVSRSRLSTYVPAMRRRRFG
jgi:hypothetical protein